MGRSTATTNNFHRVFSDPQDVMPFGKYKGKSIETLMEIDPQYLLWAVENIDSFDIDQDLLDRITDALQIWRP